MNVPDTPDLVLDRLREGVIGISPTGAATLIEACYICFHSHKHPSKVQLTVDGNFAQTFQVIWRPEEITDQVNRFWNDPDRAAEWGAEGLACLLIIELTEYTIIDRSRKGTGFDYWLGYNDDEPLFTRRARLEVSGIFKGTQSDIQKRTLKKIKQTSKSDATRLPAYAVVVEFSRPLARIAHKA